MRFLEHTQNTYKMHLTLERQLCFTAETPLNLDTLATLALGGNIIPGLKALLKLTYLHTCTNILLTHESTTLLTQNDIGRLLPATRTMSALPNQNQNTTATNEGEL